MLLLEHEDGVPVAPSVRRMFANQEHHDPADLAAARALVSTPEPLPLGCLYRNLDADRYDLATAQGLGTPVEDRLAAIDTELDRFAI